MKRTIPGETITDIMTGKPIPLVVYRDEHADDWHTHDVANGSLSFRYYSGWSRGDIEAIRPVFKPFDEADWYGLAGAEKFGDGAEPLVCYDIKVDGLDTMAVVDANGFMLQVLTPDGETISEVYYNQFDPNSNVGATAIFRFLATLKSEYETGELRDMGLEPMRDEPMPEGVPARYFLTPEPSDECEWYTFVVGGPCELSGTVALVDTELTVHAEDEGKDEPHQDHGQYWHSAHLCDEHGARALALSNADS